MRALNVSVSSAPSLSDESVKQLCSAAWKWNGDLCVDLQVDYS